MYNSDNVINSYYHFLKSYTLKLYLKFLNEGFIDTKNYDRLEIVWCQRIILYTRFQVFIMNILQMKNINYANDISRR